VPELSVNSVTILDGAVVLTQRQHSAAWQARFRIGNKWMRVTTKQKELEKAKETARTMYMRAQFRSEEGLPVVSKRFSQVAALAKNKLQAAFDAGEGKSVYKDYIIAIGAKLRWDTNQSLVRSVHTILHSIEFLTKRWSAAL
jgi:carboxypeptidase C (cathepsin A)